MSNTQQPFQMSYSLINFENFHLSKFITFAGSLCKGANQPLEYYQETCLALLQWRILFGYSKDFVNITCHPCFDVLIDYGERYIHDPNLRTQLLRAFNCCYSGYIVLGIQFFSCHCFPTDDAVITSRPLINRLISINQQFQTRLVEQ